MGASGNRQSRCSAVRLWVDGEQEVMSPSRPAVGCSMAVTGHKRSKISRSAITILSVHMRPSKVPSATDPRLGLECLHDTVEGARQSQLHSSWLRWTMSFVPCDVDP